MSKDIEWFKEEMNSMHRKRDPDRNPDEWFISKNELLEALNQLDEPEVLSREWIDGYKVLRTEMDGKVRDLRSLLVPKQEEVTEEQAWEHETVVSVIVDYLQATARLTQILDMEVEVKDSE